MSLFLHTTIAKLAALAGLAVIVYALWGTARRRPHDKVMKRLAITFRSLMDIALFMGLVVIMTHHGGFATDLGIHVVMMLLATVVAHVVPSVMRKRPREERTLLPYAVATAASLGLLLVGVVVIVP